MRKIFIKGLFVIFVYFPLFQHRGFYFPPPANKNRAVNSMEIKDFIILWTYSQCDMYPLSWTHKSKY